MAGFEAVFVNELVPQAMESYIANRRGHAPWLEEDRGHVLDIFDLTTVPGELEALRRRLQATRGVKDLDLVVGGPPCQGYSGIGHRRTFTDVRKLDVPSNHLYREMAKVIRHLKPKIFVFENVKGLLSSKWTPDGEKGEIWRDVYATFANIEGYQIRHAVVQAKFYGVPQNRPRVLLVGIRDDLGWRPIAGKVADGLLPEPAGVAPDPEDFLGDLVDPAYLLQEATKSYTSDAITRAQRWFRTGPDGLVFPRGHVLTEQEYSRHAPRIVAKFVYMLQNGGQIRPEDQTKKFAQRVLPRLWGEEGPSITATSLPDDYVHFVQPRVLTVREWARVQTFPDWYQFAGKRTTGGRRRAGNPGSGDWSRELPKYTQIGNAVPVWLAAAVGRHLRDLLDD
jgi:DNA (cytosine-5)-methyltransferase 1